jgi:hypothetical protein
MGEIPCCQSGCRPAARSNDECSQPTSVSRKTKPMPLCCTSPRWFQARKTLLYPPLNSEVKRYGKYLTPQRIVESRPRLASIQTPFSSRHSVSLKKISRKVAELVDVMGEDCFEGSFILTAHQHPDSIWLETCIHDQFPRKVSSWESHGILDMNRPDIIAAWDVQQQFFQFTQCVR